MLPFFLNMLGLNKSYQVKHFNLSNKRALIIATNHGILGTTGKKTGVYASELTVPYYRFLDNKIVVDVASIKGGKIPIEPVSLKWPVITPSDKRFLLDDELLKKTSNSASIKGLDFSKYDLVFIAGGWGAAYDLGYSKVLGEKLSKAYAKDVVLGSVCHGALGFLLAKDKKGRLLIKGKRMTAVTDKQVKELKILMTPQHPERELRKAGALFESESKFLDIFSSHVVIDDNLVTGQNQNDGAKVADSMMEIIIKRAKR